MIDLEDWQLKIGFSNKGAAKFFGINETSFSRMKRGLVSVPKGINDQAIDAIDAIIDIKTRYGVKGD